VEQSRRRQMADGASILILVGVISPLEHQNPRDDLMTWRLAKSLAKLRDQVNERHPKRKKHADGSIGDSAHSSRASDHNPHIKDAGTGVVSALDLTHDPANGFDSYAFAESLRLAKDPRCKYVISNGRIFSSTTAPWVWRKYTGSNPHKSHVHISVLAEKRHYDHEGNWSFSSGSGGVAPPSPEEPRRTLRRGDRGGDVKIVQKLLETSADGIFGGMTEMAVKVFQRGEGLASDGIVGPLTWVELDKLEQVPRTIASGGGEDDEGEDDEPGAG
jgi:hypothetical protein